MDSQRLTIEQELRTLRARYAAYKRSAKRIRILIVVAAITLVLFLLWIIARFIVGDWVAGVFLVGFVGSLWAACWMAPTEIRWRQVLISAVFGKDPVDARGSTSGQAQYIENEIARLEQELNKHHQSP